jgi:replicative DNA helicase
MSQVIPHDAALEQSVLGAILFDNDNARMLGEAPPEVFFDPVHAAVYEAALERMADGEVADAVTLKFRLREHAGLKDLGGDEYLVKLQMAAAPASLMRDYVKELRNLYGRREAMRALDVARDRLTRHDTEMTPHKALELCEADISSAIQAVQDKPLARSWLHGMHRAIEQMNEAYEKGVAPGVSTGLQRLDRVIGSMGKGDLLILAGRPSMGKSAIALNMAVNAALRGEGVFFASLEMGAEQLAQRALSQILAERGHDIAYSKMRQGSLDEAQFAAVLQAAGGAADWPIYTCDPSCRSLLRLRGALSAAERQFRSQGRSLGLIVVDYLQLVEPTGRYRAGDTNGRVSAASEAMKAMARHYDVPVLCLSQLNRAVEMRDPPVPTLSDLRDSGSIEQDADVVMFAYRPEYYTAKKLEAAQGAGKGVAAEADIHAEMAGQRNRLKIIVAKQRNGPPGTASLWCDVSRNAIADEAPQEQEGAF